MLKEQIRSSINTGERRRRVPMRLLRADDFFPKRERERKKKSEGIEKKKCSSLKNALLLRTRRVWSDGNPVCLSCVFFFIFTFSGSEILHPNRQREPVFLDADYLLAVQNLGRRFQQVRVGVPVLTANKRVRIERCWEEKGSSKGFTMARVQVEGVFARALRLQCGDSKTIRG